MADRDETTGRFLAGNRAGKKGGPARRGCLPNGDGRLRMGAAVVNATGRLRPPRAAAWRRGRGWRGSGGRLSD